MVLLSRFSSLISTYHTLKSFKEKRTFVGGFSTFCLESFGTTTENFKFGFVVASYEVSKKWSVFAVLIKSRAFFYRTNSILSVFYHNFVTNTVIYKIHNVFFIIFTCKSFWLDDRVLGMVLMFLRSGFEYLRRATSTFTCRCHQYCSSTHFVFDKASLNWYKINHKRCI